MSVIEYQFLDPSADQARWTGSLSPSPLTLLGPFTVKSSTSGLTTGVPICTLPVGAVVYDIGVFVTTGFDGTTPLLDVGSFSGTTGLFANLAGTAVELADALVAVTDNAGLESNQDSHSWLAAAVGSVGAAAGAAFLPPEVFVSAISTLSVVVSQDGTKGGTAAGSTTGTALVYVVVATPFTS